MGREPLQNLFDIEAAGAEVRTLLEAADGAQQPGSMVAVGMSDDPRKVVVMKDVENSMVIQGICRKAFENLTGIDEGERFRELVKQYPPFGMTDLEIKDSQIGMRPLMSLTRYREMIYPDELTGKEDLSQFIIDRKSKAYVESLRKKRPDKRALEPGEEDGKERPARRSSVPAEHGGDVHAAPWWSVIAVVVVAMVGLGWVLLGRKSSTGPRDTGFERFRYFGFRAR